MWLLPRRAAQTGESIRIFARAARQRCASHRQNERWCTAIARLSAVGSFPGGRGHGEVPRLRRAGSHRVAAAPRCRRSIAASLRHGNSPPPTPPAQSRPGRRLRPAPTQTRPACRARSAPRCQRRAADIARRRTRLPRAAHLNRYGAAAMPAGPAARPRAAPQTPRDEFDLGTATSSTRLCGCRRPAHLQRKYPSVARWPMRSTGSASACFRVSAIAMRPRCFLP